MTKKIPQDQIRAIKAKENSGLIKRIGKENSSGLIKRVGEKVKEEKVKENSSGLIKRAGEVHIVKDTDDKNDKNDILDITTNRDNSLQEFPKKNFKMWIVKTPDSSEKVAGSSTIVRSQHYGQAVDDYIINWNKRKRMGKTIGYPIVQGKAVSEDEM